MTCAFPPGVRPSPSGKKIYIVWWHKGNKYREPLNLEPTPENIAIAAELRNKRIRETASGRYCNDLKHIPDTVPDKEMLRLAYKSMFSSARKRREYTLTKDEEQALIRRAGNRCELTGLCFSLQRGGSSKAPFAPSLDRIDSSLNYEYKNVRLVCVVVNLAMNEWGESVLKAMAEGYVSTSVFSTNDKLNDKYAFGL